MAGNTLESRMRGKLAAKFFARFKRSISLLITFGPVGIVNAAYNFNFPEPVTPIARETLHIHNEFMLIITSGPRSGDWTDSFSNRSNHPRAVLLSPDISARSPRPA